MTITTDHHVFFYSGREVYSNWHHTPGQLVLPMLPTGIGPTFESTEQAFMWCKAWFFNDNPTMSLIEKETDPRAVKALGRLIKGYDDPSWECVREGFMAYVNLAKYRQNPEWGAMLKATDNRILVEASPVDFIWGVGMDVNAAAAHVQPGARDEVVWPGRNLLGKALMTVRGLL